MPVAVSIKADVKALTRDLNRVERKIVPKIVSQSINRGVRSANTLLVRGLAGATGVPQQKLRTNKTRKGRIRPFFASPNNWIGGLDAWLMPIKMIYFGRITVTKRGARKGKINIPGGFVDHGPKSGKLSVFTREPNGELDEVTIKLLPMGDRIAAEAIISGRSAAVKQFEGLLAARLRRKG